MVTILYICVLFLLSLFSICVFFIAFLHYYPTAGVMQRIFGEIAGFGFFYIPWSFLLILTELFF